MAHVANVLLQGECNSDRLESVFVVHRHSVRAPTYFPPGDPHLNNRIYTRGTGYLTKNGIRACDPIGEPFARCVPYRRY